MSTECQNCGNEIVMLCRLNTPFCCEACLEEYEAHE